jgi:hypothetical protein
MTEETTEQVRRYADYVEEEVLRRLSVVDESEHVRPLHAPGTDATASKQGGSCRLLAAAAAALIVVGGGVYLADRLSRSSVAELTSAGGAPVSSGVADPSWAGATTRPPENSAPATSAPAGPPVSTSASNPETPLTPSSGVDADDSRRFLGLNETEAAALAEELGYEVAVLERDGTPVEPDDNGSRTRVNVRLVDGRVAQAFGDGEVVTGPRIDWRRDRVCVAYREVVLGPGDSALGPVKHRIAESGEITDLVTAEVLLDLEGLGEVTITTRSGQSVRGLARLSRVVEGSRDWVSVPSSLDGSEWFAATRTESGLLRLVNPTAEFGEWEISTPAAGEPVDVLAAVLTRITDPSVYPSCWAPPRSPSDYEPEPAIAD